MIELIETKRLLIRNFTADDAVRLAQYRSKKEVARYQSWHFYSLNRAKKRIAYCMKHPYRGKLGNYQLAIELKSNHDLIGDLYIEVESTKSFTVGYTFDSIYWSNGYAYEALDAFFAYQKDEYHFKKVYAHVYQDNERSLRLLKKLDFTPYHKSYFYHDVSLYKDLK